MTEEESNWHVLDIFMNILDKTKRRIYKYWDSYAVACETSMSDVFIDILNEIIEECREEELLPPDEILFGYK